MATADETGERRGAKTFVNRTPARDVRAGIWGVDRDCDRNTTEPACPARSQEGRLPVRDLDMSRIGDEAASDRYTVTALTTKNRTYGENRDVQVLVLTILDDIIRTRKKLHAVTLLSSDQFDYICAKFAERVAERGLDRLFWDDDLRASDPGTRSRLYIRHAVLLSLYRKKDAGSEAALGTFFGIDQGTASRYLKVVNEVLAEILPTARNYAAMIRKIYKSRDDAGADASGHGGTTTPTGHNQPDVPADAGDNAQGVREIPSNIIQGANAGQRTPDPERPGPLSTSGPPAPVAATDDPPAPTIIGAPSSGDAIPGILAGPALEAAADGQLSTRVATITDGTHTPAERTNDSDWNRATYSGKNKAHTYNTNITTAPDGTIIGISETVPGSTNDLTLLRESPPDFGEISEAAADPETPEEDRPINIYDRGYQGIQKDTPGAETWIGKKRNAGSDPETGGLTQEDLDHNTEVTRVRIVVEHAIGRIKQYRVMTRPYHGTPDEFNDELNIVTGLVNLKHGWDRIIKSEDPALMARLGAWRTR